MKEVKNIRRGRHCQFDLHAHLVFVTKYRGKVLSADVLDRLQEIFAKVCSDMACELIEFNGENDHVHLHVMYTPSVQLSHLVNSLKGVSSRLIRKEFSDQISMFKDCLWSRSYFAGSCGGAPLEVLDKYIQNQGK